MKTYRGDKKRIWYDPHLRMWTLQVLDSNDPCFANQVGDTTATSKRDIAFEWLNKSETKRK